MADCQQEQMAVASLIGQMSTVLGRMALNQVEWVQLSNQYNVLAPQLAAAQAALLACQNSGGGGMPMSPLQRAPQMAPDTHHHEVIAFIHSQLHGQTMITQQLEACHC